MTFNRRVLTVLGACVFTSAVGFGYLAAVAWVESEIRKTAKAKWD